VENLQPQFALGMEKMERRPHRMAKMENTEHMAVLLKMAKILDP